LATVQIKREDLKEVKDFKGFLAKLNDMYDGKWVAILANGEIVADQAVEKLHELAAKKHSSSAFLFHASKKGESLL